MIPRQPRGIPTGGQFAATSHAEAGQGVALRPPILATVAGDHIWEAHTRAEEVAAERTGLRSGSTYSFSHVSLQAVPGKPLEGVIVLSNRKTGKLVRLAHDYHSNVTSLTDRTGDNSTADSESIQAAVADIAPDWFGDPAGLFTRLRETAVKEPGLERCTRNALLSVPGPWTLHHDAQEAAAASVGLRDGESHRYNSTALMINPQDEPEAYINLQEDSGVQGQLTHNYATGESAYLSRVRRTRTADPDKVHAVLSDIGGGTDAGEFFGKLRTASLAEPKLHSKLRKALNQ
ncbi:hypothetical protein [Arthrobacter sp. A2-55]|uniref:hypothetical protein n=1 Tax=Arthrobacter sp. A2-55 TaxID=2897337 RepID=UPI0021CD8607|nr:hypothetical protein [Arthrobacter sp. A2-55]MCU6480185.1 hypothetical protein [Arthrobacter sp. A2-55]